MITMIKNPIGTGIKHNPGRNPNSGLFNRIIVKNCAIIAKMIKTTKLEKTTPLYNPSPFGSSCLKTNFQCLYAFEENTKSPTICPTIAGIQTTHQSV